MHRRVVSRNIAKSKMELFVRKVNNLRQLTFVHKELHHRFCSSPRYTSAVAITVWKVIVETPLACSIFVHTIVFFHDFLMDFYCVKINISIQIFLFRIHFLEVECAENICCQHKYLSVTIGCNNQNPPGRVTECNKKTREKS